MVSEEQNSDIELASEVVPVPQVQPQIEAPEVVNKNEEANDIPRGKERHRKKALHAAILKQMEFYFSDSNLSKDRFIGQLLKEDPNVDIEIFLKFNRIRVLTTDVNRIAKALRKSTMLKVSDDGKKVCRITPIVEKLNVDECTVYVQRLPPDADHEWLSSLFSEYGPVAYVSIPKFRYNNKIKGFAFVEFDTPENAEKCLKAFEAKGSKLPSQTSPTDLLSITMHTEDENQEENDSEFISHNIDNSKSDKNINGNKEQGKESGEPEKRKCKRRKKKSLKNDDVEDSEIDQTDSTKLKKKKNFENKEKDPNLPVHSSDVNTDEEKRGKKRKHRMSMEAAHESDTELQKNVKDSCKKIKKTKVEAVEAGIDAEDSVNNESDKNDAEKNSADCLNEEASGKKKKKKRKRTNRNAYVEPVNMELQVMGKKDWKKLRNKYLDLQRSKMKQLKQHMRKARWNQWSQSSEKNKIENKNEEFNNSVKKEKTGPELSFTPGVIIKMNLSEACTDPKSFKAELRSNNSIKFIDIKEGSNEAYIRCDSSEAAKEISQKTSEGRSYTILTGAEEKSYWEKISRDREEKFSNKIRVKSRGRDKLLKKAEKELGKHIKFDEV